MTETTLEYRLHPRWICLLLGCLALYLVIQSLIAEYFIENVLNSANQANAVQVLDLFSVNAESTIPTWFSILLLFGAAVLLAHIALGERYNHSPDAWYWTGLAFIFLYLSIDEGVAIHEIASDVIQAHFQVSGYLTFGWQIAAAPFILIFGLLYLRFLIRLPARTRLLMVVSGCLYVGGAFLGDAISANTLAPNGDVTFPYLVVGSIEELCEMLGVIMFIYTLMGYATEKQYGLRLIPTKHGFESLSLLSSWALRGAIVGVIAVNAILVGWAMTQPPTLESVTAPLNIPLQSLIDQFPSDNVLMVRLIGRFDGSNAETHQVVGSLLNLYDEVLIVTLPSEESSFALAAETLPLTRDDAIEILRANGVTQFTIFDTQAVKMFITAAQGS